MNDDLHALTAAQHGLLARRQALSGGLSAGQWGCLAKSDDWKRVYAGVFRRVGAPQTWEQALIAGCLAVDGIASHRAAASLSGRPPIEPRPEIGIPDMHPATPSRFGRRHACFRQPADPSTAPGVPGA